MFDGTMQVMFEFDEKIREQYALDGYASLKKWFETYMSRVRDLMEFGE